MADRASTMPEPEYILGHSGREILRPMRQAAILRPITERLLRSAGVRPGMRVLDLGCGSGDVTMLAAELVGASGSVVGIDRSPEVIAVARGLECRARELVPGGKLLIAGRPGPPVRRAP